MLFRSNDTATTEIYTLSLHDALPIYVLLVEDIVDSGLTLDRLRERILGRSPASLRVCALLARRSVLATRPGAVDYLGRAIPPGFVVGYGIDCGEDYRYLPDIWVLEEE